MGRARWSGLPKGVHRILLLARGGGLALGLPSSMLSPALLARPDTCVCAQELREDSERAIHRLGRRRQLVQQLQARQERNIHCLLYLVADPIQRQ